jgi:hypothetical protein
MGSYQLPEAHTSEDIELKIRWSGTRFGPEDGGSNLLQNVGNRYRNYTVQ